MSDQFNKAKDSVEEQANDARADADSLRDQGEAAINETHDDLDESIERLRGHTDTQQQDHAGGAMDSAKGWFEKIKQRFTGGS